MNSTQHKYRVAVVGCGKGGEGVGGHSIGYAHGADWKSSSRVELIGACDLNAENLSEYQEHFGVPYGDTDVAKMIKAAQPDIISICSYAGARRAILEEAVASGVKGVWCEKPFALAMDDARAMVDLCNRHGVKMIVNHCRRPLPKLRAVRDILNSGKIGEPVIFMASLNDWDQMEWGTHWHDLFRMWAGDQPVQWMMGQARCSGKKHRYGHYIEDHSVAYYSFQDGTRALLDGGIALRGSNALQIVGTEGLINIGCDGNVTLINRDGLQQLEIEGSIHPGCYGTTESVQIPHSLLDWIEGGPEPELSAANALMSTELYLACYESAKVGDRIDLPLGPQNQFPLDSIVARQGDGV